MHIAWLYLLHAQFRKDNVDYRYRLQNGRFDRIDGEPKTWDLAMCIGKKWPAGGPIRTNLELTIGLRNKVEHRYHEAITSVTSGYAQALLINFENELTTVFGPEYSLGEQLRFPIFVGSITALGQAQLGTLRSQMPKGARDFLAKFESGLDASIINDHRYEFRVTLVPKLGSKTSADTAMTFVREDELSEEERQALTSLGRSGRVVVREQLRRVASAGLMKPAEAAVQIESRIPLRFKVHHVVRAWKKLACRPLSGDSHPERTDERYCVYDEPHRDYLFTAAFIDKVVKECSTATKFRAFTGLEPQLKNSDDSEEEPVSSAV
jgi:hypothetical protein